MRPERQSLRWSMASRSFGGLAGAARARRDSPFAAALAEEPATEKKGVTPAAVEQSATAGAEPAPEVEAQPLRPKRRTPRRKPKPALKEALENVTVPMTERARAKASELARELQRRRPDKSGRRITPNTVFRVAIEHFLEVFELRVDDLPSDEQELVRLVRERMRG